jgi:hypothetical protein
VTIRRVREVRHRLFATGTVVARADGRSRELFPVAIGIEEGLALHEWVRKEGALRTLETGLGFAISSLFICAAFSCRLPRRFRRWRWVAPEEAGTGAAPA